MQADDTTLECWAEQCPQVKNYRLHVMVDDEAVTREYCSSHATMMEWALDQLHISHGREYIGIGSSSAMPTTPDERSE